jgi:A/G-specific adenine glycosylase
MSYYEKFVEKYPKIEYLASANEQEVLSTWQGLGYYSRARNLHTTAKQITSEYKGVFPSSYEQILKLKGVGEYTAAAIASFAYNKPYAVVDGNVFRLLSRIFNIETPIDSTEGKKQFTYLANELMDKNQPALFNQAIMEFGALQFVKQIKIKMFHPYL